MDIIGDIWNAAIMGPMINTLVLLYHLLFKSFGPAIIVFTVLVRLAMIPLTLKQSRQMKKMSELQPKVKQVQERYPNDKAKASSETMRLYREQGVNPLGCLGPMVVQMPIFFGLFWTLRATLPTTPERLADLSQHLYSWLPQVNQTVPLEGGFLWMDLAETSSDNPLPWLLPLLVGGSMWIMQKMSTMPSTSPQSESTQRMMLWMMPIMFGFFTLNFQAGLALYWIVSNVAGVVIQGFTTGWQPLLALASRSATKQTVPASEVPAAVEEAVKLEDHRDDGQDPRRGNRARSKGARRRARGGRNRRR